MNKFTLILVSVVLSLSATTALAMNGQADRANKAGSYPTKTAATIVDVRVSAR